MAKAGIPGGFRKFRAKTADVSPKISSKSGGTRILGRGEPLRPTQGVKKKKGLGGEARFISRSKFEKGKGRGGIASLIKIQEGKKKTKSIVKLLTLSLYV